MGNTSDHLFVVILAGGGGTRLWPRSTTAKPKQFLRLISEKSMLQETYARISRMVPPQRVIVVTNERYKRMVQDDLPQVPPDNILAEPVRRDTAMAMGIGAAMAHHLDPDAVIVNLAADHMVTDVKDFHATIEAAVMAARLGDFLVTVGIHPSFPHMGLGYIKVADQFKRINGMHVFTVDSFTEKPKLAKARAFIATGKYFWNANNYVWTSSAILDAFRLHLPSVYAQLVKVEAALGTRQQAAALEAAYAVVPSISIDYGISEKASNLLLIPGDFGWSDIGDWQVVYELSKKDSQANMIDQSRVASPVILGTKGCLINGGRKLLAAVGIENLIVVETKKALLLVPRSRAQEVKQVVEELKRRGLTEYL